MHVCYRMLVAPQLKAVISLVSWLRVVSWSTVGLLNPFCANLSQPVIG